MQERLDELEAGVAMSLALSSAPIVPNKKFNLSLGLGVYKDTAAVSGKISYAVNENLAIGGGLGLGDGNFGGAVGVTIGW
jgi:hypothetical protein